MNIGLLSDSHLSPRTWDIALGDMLPATGSVDVMVLLGDIGPYYLIPDICCYVQQELECEVIFVPGNHDYYIFGGRPLSMEEIHDFWREALKDDPKIHCLIDEYWDFGDVSFFGSTWWSKLGDEVDRSLFRLNESGYSDFSYIIRAWNPQTPRQPVMLRSMDLPLMNSSAKLAYSQWQMKKKGKKRVLCAHFPMLLEMNHPGYGRNVYFNSEDDQYIIDRSPEMIFFGHTHWNIRKKIHEIPCFSNMYGYKAEAGAVGFDQEFLIEI